MPDRTDYAKELDEKIKKWSEKWEKDHALICPHCNKTIYPSDIEFMERLITYHGEDGPIYKECPYCEKGFWVNEKVNRTWDEFKTAEEAYK